jgi:hypothetical protein
VPRWPSDTLPVIAGGLREIKNIHGAPPTTPLAGIGTITTDGQVVTQEYLPWYQATRASQAG